MNSMVKANKIIQLDTSYMYQPRLGRVCGSWHRCFSHSL